MERKTKTEQQAQAPHCWNCDGYHWPYESCARTQTADRRHDASEIGFGCYRTNTHLEAA